jgi:hypothetical protein
MQAYSNTARVSDPYALPDIEVFQLTAREVAAMDEDTCNEYMRRHEFRLAFMNSKARDAMLDAMVSELGIEGGWFYWYCQPGCLPDSEPFGPFESEELAKQDAIDNATEE